MYTGAVHPLFLFSIGQTLVQLAQFPSLLFYPLHTYLIKKSLQRRFHSAIMTTRKVNFQSPFHFLISLFSWTPRERLVIDPGALHVRKAGQPVRTKSGNHRYPIIYARYRPCGWYRAITFVGAISDRPQTYCTFYSSAQCAPLYLIIPNIAIHVGNGLCAVPFFLPATNHNHRAGGLHMPP